MQPQKPPGEILTTLDALQDESLERLGQKTLALQSLVDVSRQISTLDLDQALRLILQNVLALTGTRRGALLLTQENGELEVELSVHLEREALSGDRLAISRSIAERAAATGEVVAIEDAPSSSVKDQASIVALGLEALLAIPLKTRDRVLGVIYVDTDSADHRMPRRDPDVLAAFGAQAAIVIDNARLHRRLQDDYFLLQRAVEGTFRFDRLIYRSQAMHRVCALLEQVVASDVTVLIQGETGTGKELVARALHHGGPRKARRFLGLNAGALPDTILESELFGHRRGAFSGAVEHKAGLFEVADGGTVFLDEIGEASPALQVRLLRLLETGTYRRVGETVDRHADVRVLAATHRDLLAEVQEGRFRADLYYRLGVFPIHIPPLRERRDDIELLVQHFVEQFNRKLGKTVCRIPRETLAGLVARDWPGNVRELENIVQRLVVLSPGEELASLAAIAAGPPASATAAPLDLSTEPLRPLADVERDYVRHVLEQVGGNQAQAARILGMKRGTFRWRLKKLGLGS